MNLEHIQAFLTLAETLNFSAAARKLGLTQPSVTRQIRLLEESLKAQLFLRDRHGVRLTRAGEAMRVQLAPIHASLVEVFENRRSQAEMSDACGKLVNTF
jgi:DNA-binding transcriptional LysR family regulator